VTKRRRPRSSTGPDEPPALALTLGDPAGIGPEILLKALRSPELRRLCIPVVVGDRGVLSRTAARLGLPDPFSGRRPRAVLVDVGLAPARLRPGRPSAAGGRVAMRCIQAAARLAESGAVAGVVTAPISKRALSLAGYRQWGHTEILARLTGARRAVMLFWSPRLSVTLLSIHVPLRRAIAAVTKRAVLEHLLFVNREWRRLFGARPRIAVAGLNPHAGEGGLMGSEDAKQIAPAVASARRRGVRVRGPFPPDTIFRRASQGEFDLVVAMHHDQGLIPMKLFDPARAVNVTLGLPWVRTSVDHGTAYDIAGRGVADPANLIEAVRLAARLARVRRGSA